MELEGHSANRELVGLKQWPGRESEKHAASTGI